MNARTVGLLSGLLGLGGGDAITVVDQCLRTELFQRCMLQLPSGPVATHYNDWDEVVAQCDNTAYYQALRLRETIKPECRSR